MRERIVAFDYLRALAITGILLCHFCHNYNSISFLGHYFGGVFVTLFIAMSGMLFGIVWNNNTDNSHMRVRLCLKAHPVSIKSCFPKPIFIYRWVTLDKLEIKKLMMETTPPTTL